MIVMCFVFMLFWQDEDEDEGDKDGDDQGDDDSKEYVLFVILCNLNQLLLLTLTHVIDLRRRRQRRTTRSERFHPGEGLG